MNLEQFLAIPANRKGLATLRQESQKYYGGLEEKANGELIATDNAPEFEFWQDCAGSLAAWLDEPAKIRKHLTKWSPESHLNGLKRVKELGYRKTLVIPF